MANHLFDLIKSRVAAGEAVFLHNPDGSVLTYAEMIDQTGRLSTALSNMGVAAGDRVAVQVEKSPLALLLYLACVRTGAVFLPLNTAYTAVEVSYFLNDAKPRLFICDPRLIEERGPVAKSAGVARIETLGDHSDGTLIAALARSEGAGGDQPRGPNDLAAILYTSGTTGRSKGAMLTHDNLASNALSLVETWRFTSRDVLIHALPVYHTHGLFVATNTVLLSGASMIFLSRFDPDDVLRAMSRSTVMMGVPTYYTRLLRHPGLGVSAARAMRLFISGSAPLLAETHRAWRDRTGHSILERYGMTETNMNTSNPYDGDRRPGTVGFALPGVHIRIVDPESGRMLPDGEIGMIEVKGPNVFQGYWRMPEKTTSEFRSDGFFMTGDLGKREDGYIQIVGRGKDLVISGGFNVYPKEVESEIDSIEGVEESAVIGAPHPDFGEGVTAVIVRKPGSTLNKGEIMAVLQKRLAKYKHPKAIYFAPGLPRNAMGKIQKNVLREMYKDTFTSA